MDRARGPCAGYRAERERLLVDRPPVAPVTQGLAARVQKSVMESPRNTIRTLASERLSRSCSEICASRFCQYSTRGAGRDAWNGVSPTAAMPGVEHSSAVAHSTTLRRNIRVRTFGKNTNRNSLRTGPGLVIRLA